MPHVVGHGVNPEATPLQRALTAARGVDPAAGPILGPVTGEDRQRALREIAERDRRRRRDRSRSLGEFAGDTALSLLGGAVSLGQAGYGIGNLVTGGFLDEATGGFSENFRRTQEFLDEAQSEPLRLRREDAFRAFEEEGVGAGVGEFLRNPSLIVDTATEALPSLIPAVGAGQLAARTAGAVGGRLAAERAAKKAVLRTVGAQTAGATNVEAVNTLREQGVDQAGRQLGGIGAGVLAGVLAPGISRITGAAGLEARAGSRLAGLATGRGTAGAVAAGAGAGAVREGVEEGAQGAAEQFAVNVVAPQNDFFTQTGRAAALGVIAGTPLGTVLGAAGATGRDSSQPAGTREAEEQRAREGASQSEPTEESVPVRQLAEQVLSDVNRFSEAQEAGQALTGVADTQQVTAEEFEQAQNAVIRQLFNVRVNEEEDQVFTSIDPDTGTEIAVSDDDARKAATEFIQEEIQTTIDTGQLPLDLSSGTALTTDAGVDQSLTTTNQADLFSRQPVGFGATQQGLAAAPEEQLPLRLPPGTEPAPGSVAPIDEETGQRDLFVPQPAARGINPEPAPTPAPAAPTQQPAISIQDAVNRTTGVDRAPGQTQGELVTERDQVLQEMFRVSEDAEGNAVYQRVNRDLQRLETVPREEAVREAEAIVKARREQRKQEARPLSERWRDALSEQLGLKKQKIKGRTFNQIVQQAEQEGVTPQSANADQFLRREALNFVPDEASATEFEAAYSEAFTPQSLDEVAEGAAPQVGINDPELLDFRLFVEGGRIDRATKSALQERAQRRGLKVTGTKEELRTRLRENLDETINAIRERERNEGARQVAQDVSTGRRERPQPVTSADRARQAEEFSEEELANAEAEVDRATREGRVAPNITPNITTIEDIISPARLEREDTSPLTDTEVQNILQLEPNSFNRKRVIEVRDGIPRLVEQSVNTGKNLRVLLRGQEGQTTRSFQEQVAEFTIEQVRQGVDLRVPGVTQEQQERPAPQPVQARATASEAELTERAQEAIQPLLTEDNVPILSREELAGLQEQLFEEINAEVRARNLNRRSMAAERVFVDTMNNAPSMGALEANFQAILQMEDYVGQLSERAQNAVVQAYSDTYDKLAPNRFLRTAPNGEGFVDYRTRAQRQEDEEAGVEQFEGPIPPRRGRTAQRQTVEEQTPLERERVQPIIDAVTEGDQDTVTVYNTVRDYRSATNLPAPPDAAGVYEQGGGVSVILENINTEEKLAEVLAHERGHRGLDQLLGDRLPAVTNRLWANSAIRSRIREKMRVEELDRARAAEEVLVDMLVHGERLNGDVASKIRSGVESFFQTALGVGKYRVPDRQINRLLQDTGSYLRVNNADAVVGQSPLTTEDAIPLDELLGSPEAITGTPRFSRVYERLAQTVPADNPEGANVNDFSVVGREAVEATATRLRDFSNSIKSGRMAREFNRFLPLNQIFNLHGRRFERRVELEDGTVTTTNPLRDIRDLTDKREATFVKMVTQARPLELFGEQFNISAHDLSRQAADLRRRNPEAADSLDNVLQYGTFYQVWPQLSFDQQSELDMETHNFTAEDRRNAHAQLQRLYQGMGEEARTLYRQIQASYRDIWETHIQALETELRRVNGGELPSQAVSLSLARRRLETGPYSPLARHGNFILTFRDGEGNVVYNSGHDTESEAQHKRKMVAQEYLAENGFTSSVTEAGDGTSDRGDLLSQGQIREIENIIADEIPDNTSEEVRTALRHALIDVYMKSVPESSFRNFSQKRQEVDGFSMDGIRAFADYTVKASRQIAGIRFDGELANAYGSLEQVIKEKERAGEDTVAERQIQRHLNAQFKARVNMEYNQLASLMSAAGFTYMMTSPSQMFVNATQTGLVTFPRLAARYGAGKTFSVGGATLANYFKAGRDFLKPGAVEKGLLSPATHQILTQNFVDGDLDFTLSNDLLDIAHGSSSLLNSHWGKVMEYMGSFIHKSEVFNRQVAAVMAAELEMAERGIDPTQELTQEQQEQLAAVTKDAINSTQFNYSKSNKPPILQGPIKQLVGQFQQFRLHMLSMYAKDIRDAAGWGNASPEEKALARRSLAYMTGAQMGFTGATGVAFAPIVFGIMDAFSDDDEDFIDSRTGFVEAVPAWFSHGLAGGVFNIDPGRFSMSTIIPLVGDLAYAPTTEDPTETASFLLERNIGPWWGLTTDLISGFSKAAGGDFAKAGPELLPKPLADPWKAIMESQTGVQTRNGVKVYEPAFLESVVKALGIRAMGEVEARNTAGAGYQANTNISLRRRKRLTRLAVAFANGDSEAQQEAMDDIREWNRINPQFAIKGQDIGRLRTTQRRGQSNVARFGIPLSQDLPPAFRRAAGQEQ